MITLRSIQQFLYCPKRWGLMEMNCEWEENAFVVLGNIVHNRVDSPTLNTFSKNKIIERAVPIFSQKYNLVGKLDQVEFIKSDKGIFISKYNDCFLPSIIEFKVSAPQKGENRIEDAVQLYGQKICLDEMLKCDCETFFYYSDTKRRSKLIIDDNLKSIFFHTIEQINYYKEDNIIPEKRVDQKCSGCSLKDKCLPKSYKKHNSFKSIVEVLNEKIT